MIRTGILLLMFAAAAAAGLSGADKKRIRTLLAEYLAAPDAKARAAIAEQVAVFEKTAGVPAIEAALREGPLLKAPKARKGETLTKVGTTVVGYTFAFEGETYRYAVDAPRKYDPGRPHAVLLDPGHGTGAKHDDQGKAGFLSFFRGHADTAGGRDWLVVRSEIVEQIGPDARNLPEDVGAAIFAAMFRDLATRYHFDPNRVYVSGLSQTGFWTWYLGRARADRFAGLAPMGAVTWEVDAYPENFRNVPVYVLHGGKDPICPVSQPRRTCPALVRQGVDLKYHEIATAKHDPQVWNRLPSALEWLKAKPRRRYPPRVSKSLQTPRDGWCYWIRVDKLAKEGDGRAGTKPTAGIDGEIDGQTIRLFSENVDAVTLGLAGEMLDLDRPVTVAWNGKTVFEGEVARSTADLLALLYDRTDWKATFQAKLQLKAPR